MSGTFNLLGDWSIGPYTWRGVAAAASIMWATAIVSVFLFHRSTRGGASTLPSGDSEESERGAPYMVNAVRGMLQFFGGIGCAVALMYGLHALFPRPPIPEGWLVIRPPNEVRALAEFGAAIWAGGREGIFVIDPESGAEMEHPLSSARLGEVNALLADGEGRLWIGHRGGLTRIDGKGATDHWSVAKGEVGDSVAALLIDREGVLWIGTAGGLYRKPPRGELEEVSIRSKDGSKLSSAEVLYEGSDGSVWVGSKSLDEGGLARYRAGRWDVFRGKEFLPHDSINAICETKGGALWIGTGFAHSGGATIVKDGRWDQMTKGDGLAGDKVRELFEDSSGRLWITSEYDGVALMEGGVISKILTPDDGLPGFEVKDILEERDGTIWVGTENGLGRVLLPKSE